MNNVLPQIQKIIDRMGEIVREYGWCNCNSQNSIFNHVCLRLKEQKNNDNAIPNDGEWDIPDISVECNLHEDGSLKGFNIEFEITDKRYSPYSNDSLKSDWLCSEFYKTHEELIRYRQIYEGHYLVVVKLNNTDEDVATMLSEIVYVFGASAATEFDTDWFFDYSRGDLSLAKFHDNLKQSTAIHNALRECLSLARKHSDNPIFCLLLSIGVDGKDSDRTLLFVNSEDISMDYIISDDDLERHKIYGNYHCLSLHQCGDEIMNTTQFGVDDLEFIEKFLTDYVLFLNPGFSADDIIATVDFASNIDYAEVDNPDEFSAYKLDFYSDGTCPTDNQLEAGVKFLLETLE